MRMARIPHDSKWKRKPGWNIQRVNDYILPAKRGMSSSEKVDEIHKRPHRRHRRVNLELFSLPTRFHQIVPNLECLLIWTPHIRSTASLNNGDSNSRQARACRSCDPSSLHALLSLEPPFPSRLLSSWPSLCCPFAAAGEKEPCELEYHVWLPWRRPSYE